MNTGHPSFAIVGAGAVGTYYGARLTQHGNPVHFLMRSDAPTVRRNGLTIRSHLGDFSLPASQLNIYDDPAKMPRVDIVIVALKTTANAAYQQTIRHLLHDSTTILTLQNGLGNEERLAELFGPHRILGGMAFTCINRVNPGVVEHLAHGHIKMGEHGGGPSDRATHIAQIFQHSAIDCEVLQSLAYGRWEKLVWNVPFNGLSALLDQTTDQLLATPAGEKRVRQIMAEVIAAANALGIPLHESLINTNIDRTRDMGAYRTSMHIDRTLRRHMEIEAILGAPAKAARHAGVDAPEMWRVYSGLAAMAT